MKQGIGSTVMPSDVSRYIGAGGILAAFAFWFAPDPARGQADIVMVGMRAVIKPSAVLRVGDRVVDTGKSPHIYFVDHTREAWLWLSSGAIAGWAREADVVELRRAIAETVLALVNRGDAALARGDHDRAIADYDQAIRLDPGHPRAHMNRGIAWQARGDSDRAIAYYDAAIKSNLVSAQA
jgi:tetratricopeptide (TPR) repeat protein